MNIKAPGPSLPMRQELAEDECDPAEPEKCKVLESSSTDGQAAFYDCDPPILGMELATEPMYTSHMSAVSQNSQVIPLHGRRPSVQSNCSRNSKFSATASASMELRFELEQQRLEAEKHNDKRSQHGISWYGMEAKTLNFSQLAYERYGGKMLWRDIPRIEQSQIIREELTSKVFLINPLCRQMKFWDLLVVFCLLFTAVVTPYECAFLEPTTDYLYVVNWLITGTFVIDMILQFFLKVKKTTKQGSIWLRERHKIAQAYLQSWFIVDVLSVIPYDDFANLTSDKNQATMENLKILRIIRVLRLIKLVRMLKASRLLKRWENSVSLTSAHIYLIKFSFLVLTAMHWMACMWGLIGSWEGTSLKCRRDLSIDDPLLQETPAGMYFVLLPENKDANDPSAWHGHSWITSFAEGRAWAKPMDPCDPFALYIVSLYWAVMTMTSIGYGDILPQTLSEYVVCTLCMMVGSVVWAYIIGAVSAILSNMYPEETVFEQRLDSFNAMVKEQDMPQSIRHRGREYIREAKFHTHYQRNLEAIRGLGTELKGVISRQMAAHYLENIWFFKRSSSLFLGDCASKMMPYFFEHREVIQLFGQLCVVERGAVGYDGRVLVPWSHWGEDFLVSCAALRMKIPPVALTFAEVVSLTRDDVNALLAEYPEEMKMWRRAAACVAMMRAVRIYRKGVATQSPMDPEQAWVFRVFEDLQGGIEAAPRGRTNQIGEITTPLEMRLERFLDRFDVQESNGDSEDANVQVIDLDKDGERQLAAMQSHQQLASMQSQLDRMESMFRESMAVMSRQIAELRTAKGESLPTSTEVPSTPFWNCSQTTM